MKPLQNYIEEEVKKFDKEFIPTSKHCPFYFELKEYDKKVKQFLSQSLHRIAKIAKEEQERLDKFDKDFAVHDAQSKLQ